MKVPQSPHRRRAMNLRKYALLLVVLMFALASVADAQRAKSKTKAKKSSQPVKTAPSVDPNLPVIPPQAVTQTPASAEHKTEAEIPRITVEELKEKLAKNAPVFVIDSRSQGSYDNSEIK